MGLRDTVLHPISKPLKRIKAQLDPNSGVNLYSRLERLLKSTPEIEALFPFESLSKHYVYEPSRQTKEHPDVFANQVRYYRLYEYFKQFYPEIFSDNVSVVDVGDTSGIILKALKRKGLSVNINPDVVEFIEKQGVAAQVGDIEKLPFDNKSFEYSFCFQCLEHLPNPVKGLSELGRITKKLVFVSIPYTTQTRIYSRQHWQELKKKSFKDGGWNEKDVRDVDGHKFEFSTSDFIKIVTHANLKCLEQFPLNYFTPLGKNRVNDGTYFNFFILKPETNL